MQCTYVCYVCRIRIQYIYIIHNISFISIHPIYSPTFFWGGVAGISRSFLSEPPPFADLDSCQRQWLFELRISHPRPWKNRSLPPGAFGQQVAQQKKTWRFFLGNTSVFKKGGRTYSLYIYKPPLGTTDFSVVFWLLVLSRLLAFHKQMRTAFCRQLFSGVLVQSVWRNLEVLQVFS